MLKHIRWPCLILLMTMTCPAHAAGQEDATPALRMAPTLEPQHDVRAPIDPSIGDTEIVNLKMSTSLSGGNEVAHTLGIDLQGHTAAPDIRAELKMQQSSWRSDALLGARALLLTLVILLAVLVLRDIFRLLKRLLKAHPQHGLCVVEADWPDVSLVLSGHPPGSSLATSLNKLLTTDYPRERVHVFPVFDPASSITRAAVDRYVALDAKHIHPLHIAERHHTAFHALQLTIPRTRSDIVIILEGPPPAGRDWLKRSVAPFFDPSVGALQTPTYALRDGGTGLENLQCLSRGAASIHPPFSVYRTLLPGTHIGGVRCSAVMAAGGLGDESPSAEIDLVKRLAERNWLTSYQELPLRHDNSILHWPAQAERTRHGARRMGVLLWQQLRAMVGTRQIDTRWPLQACVAPMLWIFTLLLSMTLYFCGDLLFASLGLAAAAAMSFNLQQSPRSFIETAMATRAHGRLERIRLLPYVALGYLIGMSLAISVLIQNCFGGLKKSKPKTDNTIYGDETELVI
ncbi:MAG TPA: hypothetical protein VFW00_14595 [Rhodocyclaceae bacterium]|nr:hypothetical protein [Rhodocyclaceae bacterium]